MNHSENPRSEPQIKDRGQLYIKWREKIKRGFLRIIVLKIFGTKSPEGVYPSYNGKKLVNHIKEHSIDNWEPSPGSIYPILNEMEEDKIISLIRHDKKSKEYRITEIGQNLLTQIQEDSILFQSKEEQWEEKKVEHFKNRFFEINMKRPLEEVKMDLKKFSIMKDLLEEIIEQRKQEDPNL